MFTYVRFYPVKYRTTYPNIITEIIIPGDELFPFSEYKNQEARDKAFYADQHKSRSEAVDCETDAKSDEKKCDAEKGESTASAMKSAKNQATTAVSNVKEGADTG